ncbi:MAG: heavy-metal-associated domain-containing protein [Saprospiraceae bacterium]|nr:heavy-metal-associated domain-containing protein [Saprospiraceae bacterium]
MKLSFFLILALLNCSFLFAGDTLSRASIEVNGNCKMCKSKIEKAALIDGVKSASWNQKTKILELEYDEKKVTVNQIQLRIAAVGYDTQLYRANDATYNNLHKCCKYPRNK